MHEKQVVLTQVVTETGFRQAGIAQPGDELMADVGLPIGRGRRFQAFEKALGGGHRRAIG